MRSFATPPSTPLPRLASRSPHLADAGVALTSRLVLFAAFQSALALLLAASGHPDAWSASVAWWPVTVVAANVASFAILRSLLRRSGSRWRDLVRFDARSVRTDLLLTVAITVAAVVVAMLPNLGLAMALWGDPQAPMAVFVQRLPLWAAVFALVAFPLTTAMTELPTYYAVARPRLEDAGARPWVALALSALLHSLQHAALPLVFDWRFAVWRGFMFLPFAALLAVVLRLRPRLLPYLMVVHLLFDLAAASAVLALAL